MKSKSAGLSEMLRLVCGGVSIITEQNIASSGDFIYTLRHDLLCLADLECQN